MKHPFPHKLQYAMNLTNNSPEAIDRINQWANEKGGSVEHMTYKEVEREVLPRLKKETD